MASIVLRLHVCTTDELASRETFDSFVHSIAAPHLAIDDRRFERLLRHAARRQERADQKEENHAPHDDSSAPRTWRSHGSVQQRGPWRHVSDAALIRRALAARRLQPAFQ